MGGFGHRDWKIIVLEVEKNRGHPNSRHLYFKETFVQDNFTFCLKFFSFFLWQNLAAYSKDFITF